MTSSKNSNNPLCLHRNICLFPSPLFPNYFKNTYLLLKKTLYVLKRPPKHWYEKAKSVFKSMGLKSIPNFPCLFTGTIIPNKPPLCLGLYVDDFICLSNSPEVEKIFEDKLNIFLQVELSSPPQILLGLKIRTCKEDNDMSIFLSQQTTT